MLEACVIGASKGGSKALQKIISSLPKNIDFPIFVVLHIGRFDIKTFIAHLQSISKVQIKEASDKEKIQKNTVYFAPSNYHLLIENKGQLALSTDPKLHHSRPAIDILFETAAWQFSNKLLGIILTGMNTDGAKGLLWIKNFGGTCIVQDPKEAESQIMPQAAINIAEPDHILGVDEIIKEITKHCISSVDL